MDKWKPYNGPFLRPSYPHRVYTEGRQDDSVVMFCMDYFGEPPNTRWTWAATAPVKLEKGVREEMFIIGFKSETDLTFFMTGVDR